MKNQTASSTFSTRNNAKRAAEKLLAAGTAPALDYRIKERQDGRFESGTAGDEQLASYLPDCDHVVSADKGFVRLVNEIGRHSPFAMPTAHLVHGGVDGAINRSGRTLKKGAGNPANSVVAL
jgi:hypothetical protein